MSNIQDMNNRIRQNREQRPSKRAKFKENNRGAIYTNEENKSNLTFKEVDKTELEKLKKSIRENAQHEQRKTKLVFLIFIMIVLLVTIGYFLYLT
nr:hypothetical protein [Allomuricauda sp.]